MVALIILIIFFAAVIGLSVGIGFVCLEFVVRMIGRGLGVGLVSKGAIHRGTMWR
jgi:hypothetical protein